MDVKLKITDYQMTPEASNYLDDKIAQIEKNIGPDSEARLEIEVGKATGRHKHSEYLYFAELQLVRPGSARLVACNHEPTVNAAMDNAKDELLLQVRREKKLHSRLWRKSGALAKRLLRLE